MMSSISVKDKWAETGKGESWMNNITGAVMISMYTALKFAAEEKKGEYTGDVMEESEVIKILSENGTTLVDLDTLLGAMISIELLRNKFSEAYESEDNVLFEIGEQLGEELDTLMVYLAEFVRVLGAENTLVVLKTINLASLVFSERMFEVFSEKSSANLDLKIIN